MDLESSVLSLDVEGHVATLWLDRPEKRNAFNLPFWDDIPIAMSQLSADPGVRCVVIAAKGSAFSVGIDLVELGPPLVQASSDDRSEAEASKDLYGLVKRFQATMTAVADCPKPVIAAVHGWCIGAGVDLITACDIRLAAQDAAFSVRETRLAMVADVGTLQRLPTIIAPGHVAELAYTGKDIDAGAAHAMGLVNSVYPDKDALLKASRELADEIAENSPLAVQGTKAVLRAGSNSSVEDALDYVALWNAAFLRSADLQEALAAFAEKRPPRFLGR